MKKLSKMVQKSKKSLFSQTIWKFVTYFCFAKKMLYSRGEGSPEPDGKRTNVRKKSLCLILDIETQVWYNYMKLDLIWQSLTFGIFDTLCISVIFSLFWSFISVNTSCFNLLRMLCKKMREFIFSYRIHKTRLWDTKI